MIKLLKLQGGANKNLDSSMVARPNIYDAFIVFYPELGDLKEKMVCMNGR